MLYQLSEPVVGHVHIVVNELKFGQKIIHELSYLSVTTGSGWTQFSGLDILILS